MRVAAFPTKAQAPLIVNADAPLPLSVSRQSFQSIAGWNAQIIDYLCRIDRLKLAPGHVLHMGGNASDSVAIEYRRGELVGERADHTLILTLCTSNVKHYYWVKMLGATVAVTREDPHLGSPRGSITIPTIVAHTLAEGA
jgi:hypothetical protein